MTYKYVIYFKKIFITGNFVDGYSPIDKNLVYRLYSFSQGQGTDFNVLCFF